VLRKFHRATYRVSLSVSNKVEFLKIIIVLDQWCIDLLRVNVIGEITPSSHTNCLMTINNNDGSLLFIVIQQLVWRVYLRWDKANCNHGKLLAISVCLFIEVAWVVLTVISAMLLALARARTPPLMFSMAN